MTVNEVKFIVSCEWPNDYAKVQNLITIDYYLEIYWVFTFRHHLKIYIYMNSDIIITVIYI